MRSLWLVDHQDVCRGDGVTEKHASLGGGRARAQSWLLASVYAVRVGWTFRHLYFSLGRWVRNFVTRMLLVMMRCSVGVCRVASLPLLGMRKAQSTN